MKDGSGYPETDFIFVLSEIRAARVDNSGIFLWNKTYAPIDVKSAKDEIMD
jgi:hypothetical protein